MDERTFRVLEYEKIKQMLAGFAASTVGKARAQALQPSDDAEWIRERLSETSEASRLVETHGSPPLGGLTDITPLISRARAQGILGPEELLQVADAMRCARRMGEYLDKGADVAPRLAEFGDQLTAHQGVETEIERCIDESANVRSNASDTLRRLTSRVDILERRVRERIEAVLRREAEKGTLQDGIIVQRSGRFCLPVQANQQARFRGIIHDRSDSGATVFMEPLEVVEAGNDLRQTSLEMEAEVERILRQLTAQVGAVASELDANLRALGIIDFIAAKAHLAHSMSAVQPALSDELTLNIKAGRHPLLSGNVVPIDIWLGDEFDTLVITGPNTGGKTVALKTLGLLALMAQSGLHIPADEGSQTTVWQYVYADIGDEQSIEQSLSTFSSHMTQIVKIINRVQAYRRNRKRAGQSETPIPALVLLDELGAGTDPTEGAALARAILTELHEAGCRTVATTHYNDLKVFAYGTDGVENASVEFDVKTLQPTYRLRIGAAGASNAFRIAQRLGLARSIVQRGSDYLDGSAQTFDQAMSEVERQRQVLWDRDREARTAQKDLEKLKDQYSRDLEKLESRRRKAVESGFDEAEAIVRRAEEQARRIIADLQRQTKQSAVTQQGRDELADLREQVRHERARAVEPVETAPEETDEEAGLTDVLLGDSVHVVALGRDGVVVGLPRKGFAEVQVGNMRTETPFSDLRPPEKATEDDAARLAARMQMKKSFSVPREIDIRGMTVDEALLDLEKYLDDAVLARFPMVRVVHGKGTGALRQGIHAFLKKHRNVREFRFAEREEGGEGATEVLF